MSGNTMIVCPHLKLQLLVAGKYNSEGESHTS